MKATTYEKTFKTGDELLESMKKLIPGTSYEALFDYPVKGNYKLIISVMENK